MAELGYLQVYYVKSVLDEYIAHVGALRSLRDFSRADMYAPESDELHHYSVSRNHRCNYALPSTLRYSYFSYSCSYRRHCHYRHSIRSYWPRVLCCLFTFSVTPAPNDSTLAMCFPLLLATIQRC